MDIEAPQNLIILHSNDIHGRVDGLARIVFRLRRHSRNYKPVEQPDQGCCYAPDA